MIAVERIEDHLRRIGEDAAALPSLFMPVELREAGPYSIVTLRVVRRCHPNLAEPDEVERAILELLYAAGRLRMKQLVQLLAPQFASATVERRLGRLVRLGVLRKFLEAPRGYELDPWLRGPVAAQPAREERNIA